MIKLILKLFFSILSAILIFLLITDVDILIYAYNNFIIQANNFIETPTFFIRTVYDLNIFIDKNITNKNLSKYTITAMLLALVENKQIESYLVLIQLLSESTLKNEVTTNVLNVIISDYNMKNEYVEIVRWLVDFNNDKIISYKDKYDLLKNCSNKNIPILNAWNKRPAPYLDMYFPVRIPFISIFGPRDYHTISNLLYYIIKEPCLGTEYINDTMWYLCDRKVTIERVYLATPHVVLEWMENDLLYEYDGIIQKYHKQPYYVPGDECYYIQNKGNHIYEVYKTNKSNIHLFKLEEVKGFQATCNTLLSNENIKPTFIFKKTIINIP